MLAVLFGVANLLRAANTATDRPERAGIVTGFTDRRGGVLGEQTVVKGLGSPGVSRLNPDPAVMVEKLTAAHPELGGYPGFRPSRRDQFKQNLFGMGGVNDGVGRGVAANIRGGDPEDGLSYVPPHFSGAAPHNPSQDHQVNPGGGGDGGGFANPL